MKKVLFAMLLSLSMSAHASPQITSTISPAFPKVGEFFEVTGQVSKFYGLCKTAEAAMWETALKTCDKIDSGLILNRQSDFTCDFGPGALVTAKATFVCVAPGNGS